MSQKPRELTGRSLGKAAEQRGAVPKLDGGGNSKGDSKDLVNGLAPWETLAAIAECQGKIWVNWHQWWPQFVLAPTTNMQEIMSRWVVGKQVNIYKSSDPALEDTIRNNIAGYGSQLGTMLDYLEKVQERLELPIAANDPKDPVCKLDQLIDQVKTAKKMFGRA